MPNERLKCTDPFKTYRRSLYRFEQNRRIPKVLETALLFYFNLFHSFSLSTHSTLNIEIRLYPWKRQRFEDLFKMFSLHLKYHEALNTSK